jgi:hypothetical protein
MTKDEIIKELKNLSWAYQQAMSTPNWRQDCWISDMLAEAAGMIESYDERKIINDFIAKVEAIALVPMGFSYVAHYEGMKKLQREMNNEA